MPHRLVLAQRSIAAHSLALVLALVALIDLSGCGRFAADPERMKDFPPTTSSALEAMESTASRIQEGETPQPVLQPLEQKAASEDMFEQVRTITDQELAAQAEARMHEKRERQERERILLAEAQGAAGEMSPSSGFRAAFVADAPAQVASSTASATNERAGQGFDGMPLANSDGEQAPDQLEAEQVAADAQPPGPSQAQLGTITVVLPPGQAKPPMVSKDSAPVSAASPAPVVAKPSQTLVTSNVAAPAPSRPAFIPLPGRKPQVPGAKAPQVPDVKAPPVPGRKPAPPAEKAVEAPVAPPIPASKPQPPSASPQKATRAKDMPQTAQPAPAAKPQQEAKPQATAQLPRVAPELGKEVWQTELCKKIDTTAKQLEVDLGGLHNDTSDLPVKLPVSYYKNIEKMVKSQGLNINAATLKKNHFVCVMLPIAIRMNEQVFRQRLEVLRIAEKQRSGATLAPKEIKWMAEIRTGYRLKADASVEEILAHVDIVPLGLLLAQAAQESGWGTSRLAEVNNLFGITAVKGQPCVKNSAEGNCYRKFDTVIEGINEYIRLMNTGKADFAARFRSERAKLRASGQRLDSCRLAGALYGYAGKGNQGQVYIGKVRTIMGGSNNLAKYEFKEEEVAPIQAGRPVDPASALSH